jgi:3-oxoacyl-[acyl-carrier protein] reductase
MSTNWLHTGMEFMGRLLSAADVERFAKEGHGVFVVAPGTIVSPLARDRIRDLGVRVEVGRSHKSDGRDPEVRVRTALKQTIARIGDADLEEVIRQTIESIRDTKPPPAPSMGPVLKGRSALVTGASSGIGAAAAVAMAEVGAMVAIGTFGADPHDAAQTLERTVAVGAEGMVVNADVTKSAEIEAACDAVVSKWGRLDIAVANAGVLHRDRLEDLTDERWHDVLNVDLGGVLRTCRAAASRMEAGGSLIAVSSIAGGVFGWAEHSHYAAAKAGVVGLVRSLAAELGPRGIRVNAVLPGLIETPQSLDAENSVGAAGLHAAARNVPLRRIGDAEDVGAAIRFLASDEARYITGHALVVDGGVSTALAL